METPLHKIFALQTWTLRHHIRRDTCDALLSRVREIGYKAIEVSARGEMRLGSFLSSAQKAGLTCAGVHVPCFCGLDAQKCWTALNRTITALSSAYNGAVPKDCVLTVMGNPEYLNNDQHRYRAYGALLGELNDHYKKSLPTGRLAYHLYDFDLTANANCLGHILESGCHMVLDSFYMWRARQPWGQVLKELGERVIACHINDRTSTGRQCPLGSGQELWHTAFEIMGQLPKCRWLIVEHDSMGDYGLTMAEKSADFLRNSRCVDGFWRNRMVAG